MRVRAATREKGRVQKHTSMMRALTRSDTVAPAGKSSDSPLIMPRMSAYTFFAPSKSWALKRSAKDGQAGRRNGNV